MSIKKPGPYHEKCKILLIEGIVLGHHVSSQEIKVEPAKIEVIVSLPSPKTQKEVIKFLGHAGYYCRIIENFTKIAAPLFTYEGYRVPMD